MARLEANCDDYIKELFMDTKIHNSTELACAISYTCGRISERGRTVPHWYEDYGHDLMCRLLALYRTKTLTVATQYYPVQRDAMLFFLYEEAPHPSEIVMKEFNRLRQTI